MRRFKNVNPLTFLVYAIIFLLPAIYAFAEHPAHDNSKALTPFRASSDKPFAVLMDEAISVMHQNMNAAQKTGDPDHDFVTMMIPHHQGAIDMAKVLLLNGKEQEIRNLSQGIISAQLNEIGFMTAWLKTSKTVSSENKTFSLLMEGSMETMHKGMAQAVKNDDPDHDFVTMMIPHHQGAIDMARALLSHGKDIRLQRLAQEIITEQQNEIKIMQAWLDRHQFSGPRSRDRVYTADQISNTVSVINPDNNTLLGQIRLGNVRPDVLSPLYKGELNVHGLGFSPDHKTLIVISTGSNAVTFIDTNSNKVKGTVYIGRSPHEGFFTPDGKEAWVVVRGENYFSVIDPFSYRETGRIETTAGPGMVIFNPNGKYAYVCNSFNPVFEVVDLKEHKVIKKIQVVSPFSPYLVMTPDLKEIWLTHKDVGKITRVDTEKLEINGVFDAGFITNHLHFAKTMKGTFVYVTVGGENAVKVFTYEKQPALIATIPVGALPHGIWPSDDGTRMYIGLENSDAVDVIDTEQNKVIARIQTGQAPQALVYISNAVYEGTGTSNLVPRPSVPEAVNLPLKPSSGNAEGFIVVRNLGLVDAFEVSVYRLKPDTVFNVYFSDRQESLAVLRTNAKGMANVTAIGPIRELISSQDKGKHKAGSFFISEPADYPDISKAVLKSSR